MKPVIEGSFESRLIKHTQSIAQHVLAAQIYHWFNSGLYDAMNTGSPLVSDLATQLNMDEDKLNGFLEYLQNEQLLSITDQQVSMTESGHELSEFRPWYIMLIGGYADTFMQIGARLQKDSGWATRDTKQVGLGSCGISHYDAIPLTRALMAEIPHECTQLLDLGCGNGLYLAEFCKQFPNINAWGVEPDEQGAAEASALIEAEGLSDRIRISCAGAREFFQQTIDFQPDLVVLGFILQELLAQIGDKATENFVRQIFERYPDIHIVIIEVDNQATNPKTMAHGLANAYYNPYYLLHRFTEQRLETRAFWDAFFERCGAEVVALQTTSPEVDSTELELGYLLKRKEH